MKTMKLITALREIFAAGLENAHFEVKVTVDGQQVTIFTSDQVFYEFANNYDTYTVCISEIFAPTTAAFIALYSDYRANTKEQLYRAWKAIQAEYDPISNYDMQESGIDGRKLDTDTVTPTGGTHTETTIKRFGIQSTTGEDYDKTESDVTPKEGAKTETSHGNTKTADFDGVTHSGYYEAKEHFFKRSGNIGVTESSSMMLHEIDARKRDLLREWVKGFIDRYCYAIGGECDDCYNL